MKPSVEEKAVVLEHLDEFMRAILKFKIREFIHLNPCFDAIPSIDVKAYPIDIRNYRRLLSIDYQIPSAAQKDEGCPNKERTFGTRRRTSRVVAV